MQEVVLGDDEYLVTVKGVMNSIQSVAVVASLTFVTICSLMASDILVKDQLGQSFIYR